MTEREVPMQRSLEGRPLRIPERVARLAYEEYVHQYGAHQSFERLHERGGFGTLEIITLLADLIERERAAAVPVLGAPEEKQ